MERFDLYDCSRTPLGRTMVRGEAQPQNTYRVVVHCCIFNSQGQMLIQRRQDFKEGWSGRWDLTCGGSPVSGESSQAAVQRELFEELGITRDFSQARPVLTVHFEEGFDDIYVVHQEVDLSKLVLQEEEVAEAKWASEAEILELIREDKCVPYHAHLIGLLFFMRTKRGTFQREETTTNN